MTLPFAITAGMTLGGAIAAMTLRNLVHCALAAAVAFAGIAVLFLQLDAQFTGFAQVLVYIGAVAILTVFAILLTRGGREGTQSRFSMSWIIGAAAAVGAFAVMAGAISSSSLLDRTTPTISPPTVRQIGDQLMHNYLLPLEVIGLLLTAALIGAVLLAMHEKEKP